jgi:hypothetical protein
MQYENVAICPVDGRDVVSELTECANVGEPSQEGRGFSPSDGVQIAWEWNNTGCRNSIIEPSCIPYKKVCDVYREELAFRWSWQTRNFSLTRFCILILPNQFSLEVIWVSYDDATQHKTPSVCTELARSKTFGKIKCRRCCGTRAKVWWGMSNIFTELVTHVGSYREADVSFGLFEVLCYWTSACMTHDILPRFFL